MGTSGMPQQDFRSPRLFVDAALTAGVTVTLERSQSNYLGNVLRLGVGEHRRLSERETGLLRAL